MKQESKYSKQNRENQAEKPPYWPSWVNRLNQRVEQLPGPSWSYYTGLGALVFLIPTAALWAEGALADEGIHPAHLYIAGAFTLMMTLIPYLDKRATIALERMSGSLTATTDEIRLLHSRLTNMPAVPTLLASLTFLAYVFVSENMGEIYHVVSAESYPYSALLLRVVYLMCWATFGVFTYHTIHQLRTINQLFTQFTRINIFQMKSLYAFSNLTAITAGCVAFISYGWIVVNPSFDLSDPLAFLPLVALGLFSFIVFLWPQLGVHRLQAAEKERLLEESDQRFQSAIKELHNRVDKGELSGLSELNTTLAALETERGILTRVATWPWDPETVRMLITALAFPLILWLLQLIMQSVFGA